MPTFFGVSAVPADNGTNATQTITVTPPASMLVGDLVILAAYSIGFPFFSLSNRGGQTWYSFTRNPGSSTFAIETFWCVFNGTWSANPVVSLSASQTNTSAVMVVFRPDATTFTWVPQQFATTTLSGGTVSIANVTPTAGPNITIAKWVSGDDNTWGTLTGTNWVKTSLAAQYRNTAGTNDMSSTWAYQIQTTPAATNAVSQAQATLGPDQTITERFTFVQVTPANIHDAFGTTGFFGL
jgi:hypothetical protein